MFQFSLKNRKKEDKKEEREKKLEKTDAHKADADFSSDINLRKHNQKQESSFDFPEDFGNDFIFNPGSQKPPSSRKTAGWSEETPSKKSWLRRGSKNFLKDSPKKELFMDSTPVTSEIPEIPDMDDLKEEELSADVAKAPSLKVYRIATYQELDNDLTRHATFQSLDGIELSLLTKRLLPDHMVKKEDETPWTWDTLFADVSSYFNSVEVQDSNISGVEKMQNGL